MVALRTQEVDGFLARPDPARQIILLYGPDAGLVRERGAALLKSAVDDPKDPFAFVTMEGDTLAAEPSLLVDEAMTVPLFGGRRAIRVRAGSKDFTSGVQTLTEMGLKDCRVVIEAGDLRPTSPLRKLGEKASNIAVIACYPDTERDLTKLIDDELRLSNLRISPDARALLMSLLGGDRQASRNEMRKLALFAHGGAEVTIDDIATVISDASDLKMDPIVDAAFAGNPAAVETEFNKAMVAGLYPGLIIMTAQRQAALLHKASLAVAEGQPAAVAMQSVFFRLHFSRKGVVETALKNLGSARLAAIIEQLQVAALDVRRNNSIGDVIAQRALMSIAVNARRRR